MAKEKESLQDKGIVENILQNNLYVRLSAKEGWNRGGVA